MQEIPRENAPRRDIIPDGRRSPQRVLAWCAIIGGFAVIALAAAEPPGNPPGNPPGKPPGNPPGEPTDAGEIRFNRDIRPIFEDRCIECHGPERQKGSLRLDRRASALAESTEAGRRLIVPGDPDASVLFQRITLPPDDFDVMPASGDPLTAEQIGLIREWIASGAEWPVEETTEPERIELPPLDGEAQRKAVAAAALVREWGGVVAPVAEGSRAVYVNLSYIGAEIDDEDLTRIRRLSPVVVWLNLARTSISDEALETITAMPELRMLHLQHTSVSDRGVAHLGKLNKLRYLNLYGTLITDGCIDDLAPLKRLEKLYVWRTGITERGAERLRELLPNTDVISGGARFVLPEEPESGAEGKARPASLPACCRAAAAADRECDHACCVKARASGEICRTCSAREADDSDIDR